MNPADRTRSKAKERMKWLIRFWERDSRVQRNGSSIKRLSFCWRWSPWSSQSGQSPGSAAKCIGLPKPEPAVIYLRRPFAVAPACQAARKYKNEQMIPLRFVVLSLALFSVPGFANEFRDNPSRVVSLADYPQFSVVGHLQRDVQLPDGRIAQHMGSAVIVSPCYALTNFHVAFDGDFQPIPGKDYTHIFRAGVGSDGSGFEGHTSAFPVLWGDAAQNDWAILRLKHCVGTLANFGWIEVSRRSQIELSADHARVAVVGYSYRQNRAKLSMGIGQVLGINPESQMLSLDASGAKGQSGGAIFVLEDGRLKLGGVFTEERLKPSDKRALSGQVAPGCCELLARPHASL